MDCHAVLASKAAMSEPPPVLDSSQLTPLSRLSADSTPVTTPPISVAPPGCRASIQTLLLDGLPVMHLLTVVTETEFSAIPSDWGGAAAGVQFVPSVVNAVTPAPTVW